MVSTLSALQDYLPETSYYMHMLDRRIERMVRTARLSNVKSLEQFADELYRNLHSEIDSIMSSRSVKSARMDILEAVEDVRDTIYEAVKAARISHEFAASAAVKSNQMSDDEYISRTDQADFYMTDAITALATARDDITSIFSSLVDIINTGRYNDYALKSARQNRQMLHRIKQAGVSLPIAPQGAGYQQSPALGVVSMLAKQMPGVIQACMDACYRGRPETKQFFSLSSMCGQSVQDMSKMYSAQYKDLDSAAECANRAYDECLKAASGGVTEDERLLAVDRCLDMVKECARACERACATIMSDVEANKLNFQV